MDEIVVAQNKYISSKRASRLTGYAQDYIGQLVRLRKVNATKVGKAWFVDEAGLMRHINGSSRLAAGGVKELAEVVTRSGKHEGTITASIDYPKTWSPITYIADDSPLSPECISDSRDTPVNKDIMLVGVGNSDQQTTSRPVTSRYQKAVHPFAGPNSHGSVSVSAISMDGIRFLTPEVNTRPPLAEVSLTEMHVSHSVQPSRMATAAGFALRTLIAGLVAATLIFFVPIVG